MLCEIYNPELCGSEYTTQNLVTAALQLLLVMKRRNPCERLDSNFIYYMRADQRDYSTVESECQDQEPRMGHIQSRGQQKRALMLYGAQRKTRVKSVSIWL